MPYFSPAETVLKTGFSLDTLRYYEKIGLLDQISRAASGQRRFSDEDISWLGMLRCLRETGMPIAEMLRFAELTRGGDETIAERVSLLEAHDHRVEDRLQVSASSSTRSARRSRTTRALRPARPERP